MDVLLSKSPSPAGSLCFFGRTKPSLAAIHLDFCVKSLIGHVVDPLAVAVHITLDNAVRRRSSVGCRSRQQQWLCIYWNAQSSEDNRFIVAVTPIPGCDERALP